MCPRGALIDRELYLPTTWTDEGDRCTEAALSDQVDVATTPELARRMLEGAAGSARPSGDALVHRR